MMTTKWTNDWETFVKAIGELFVAGVDNATVTERFAGKRVVWSGEVAGKRLDIDPHGIQMKMPAITVAFPDGRSADVDFVFLTLAAQEIQLWRAVAVGDTVRFATRIRQSSGPFPGITCSDLDEEGYAILFLTNGAVPLRDES